jgi:hypothetical protein
VESHRPFDPNTEAVFTFATEQSNTPFRNIGLSHTQSEKSSAVFFAPLLPPPTATSFHATTKTMTVETNYALVIAQQKVIIAQKNEEVRRMQTFFDDVRTTANDEYEKQMKAFQDLLDLAECAEQPRPSQREQRDAELVQLVLRIAIAIAQCQTDMLNRRIANNQRLCEQAEKELLY